MTTTTSPSTEQVQASIRLRDALLNHIESVSELDGGGSFDLAEDLLKRGFIDIPAVSAALEV